MKRILPKVLLPKKDVMMKHKQFINEKRVKKTAKILSEFGHSKSIENEKFKIINVETLNPNQALSMIDSDFNNFFQTREVNHHNINLLFQVLNQQRNFKEAQILFNKIKYYQLKRREVYFCHLIEISGKCNEIQVSERIFDEAIEKFGWSIYLSNALIYSYSFNKELEKAENIFKQSQLKGLKMDCPIYTSLISCAYKQNNVKKCWDYYEEMLERKVEIDDILLGIMVKICRITQDCEKAIKIFRQMEKLEGIRMNCLHYNALLQALGSRKEYCEEALETYDRMVHLKIQPNFQTFLYTLKASSILGNIKRSYEIVLNIKNFQFTMNKICFFYLLQTYTSAIEKQNLPQKLKKQFLEDSWAIFKEMENVDSFCINQLFRQHLLMDQLLQAEDVVFPLFEQYKLEPNSQTYQFLIQHYISKGQLIKIVELYESLPENQISFRSLNIILSTYFRLKDVGNVIKILDIIESRNMYPNRTTIRKMGFAENMPDSIIARLMKIPFFADKKVFRNVSQGKDEQERQRIKKVNKIADRMDQSYQQSNEEFKDYQNQLINI